MKAALQARMHPYSICSSDPGKFRNGSRLKLRDSLKLKATGFRQSCSSSVESYTLEAIPMFPTTV